MSAATAPAPPPPAYAYPSGYPAKFIRYHERYPQVYAGIVRRLRQLRARGFRDVPVRYCIEDLRLSEEAPRASVETRYLFAIDNNFAPWYGRLIDANEEDLRGCIRMRRTRPEIDAQDAAPLQERMEFE